MGDGFLPMINEYYCEGWDKPVLYTTERTLREGKRVLKIGKHVVGVCDECGGVGGAYVVISL